MVLLDRINRPKVLLVNRCLIQNKGNILLLKRPKSSSWCPNRWEFPGGKLENGQDIEDFLRREVFEETGLEIPNQTQVVYVKQETSKKGKYAGMPCVTTIYKTEINEDTVVLSKEHTEFTWVSPGYARQMELTEDTKEALTANLVIK